MPNHSHNILYNGSGAKFGLWGSASTTGGNFGNPNQGASGYAYTSLQGGGQPVNLTIPTPPSYTINYYIYAGYSGQ